jgi:hypothetical protein
LRFPGSLALAGGLLAAACAAAALGQEKPAAAPVVVCDFSAEKDVAPGEPMARWFAAQAPRWTSEFGTPSYFSIAAGALRLVSKQGPLANSWNPSKLMRREDKVILRITPEGFRVPVAALGRVEVTMAPVRLPGKGADLTDSSKNDACFYLFVGFDGPLHSWHGAKMPDTVAYVWADGAWRSGAEVGKDGKYDAFLRYLALGRGPDRLGEMRTFARELAPDFRKAFPERGGADGAVPDVVRVGVMIDSNTVVSEAESALRSIRFIP